MDSIDILKRKRIGFGFFIKTISVFLITCFVVQDLASAAPEIASRFVPYTPKKIILKIPTSIATIKNQFLADSAEHIADREDGDYPLNAKRYTLYLIEDAHTNESAQRNIAKLIDRLVKEKNIDTVFLEAGSADDSLSDLKKDVDIKIRHQAANKFLKKGWIQGPDYANLISDQGFKLWGVEDKKLYWKEIKLYQSLQRKREDLNAHLDSYDRLVKTLKNKLYNPLLKIFDDQHEAFLKEKLSQTDYLEILEAQRKALGISGSSFPHLAVLQSLRNKELRIDFKKAGEEALHAVNSLSEEDRLELMAGNQGPIKEMDDRETSVGFYLALEEKLVSSRAERSVVEGSKIPRFGLTASLGMTELFKYFDYLKEYQKLSAEEVLTEQAELENHIYKNLLRTEDELLLKKISDNLKILRKVINLKASSKDFESIQSAKLDFDVIQIAGILNRKIMDLESNYEDVVFLKKDLVNAARQARQFYSLANKRDHAFLRNMINVIASEAKQSQIVSSLSASRNNSFILVAGGYHTEHLQKLLKENQISFVSITPRILQETSDKKYESLLLNKPSNSAVGVLPARELVLRSEGSVVNVYESLAGELNKPDYSFHEGSRLARKDRVQTSIKKRTKTDIRQYLEKIEGLMKEEPWRFYQESGVDPRVASDVHLMLLDMKRFISNKLLQFDRTRVKDLEFRKLHAVRHAAEDLYLILEALHNLNARNIKFVRKDNLPNGSKGRMFHFAMQSGEDKSWHQIHIVARQFASSSEQPRFGIRIIKPDLEELSFRIDFSKNKSNGSKNSYYVAAIDLPNSFRALINDKNSWHRGIRWIADPNVFASLVQNLSSKVEKITQEGSRLARTRLLLGLILPDSHTMIYPAPRHDLYAVGEMLDQFPELDISTVVLVDKQFFDEWDTPNNLIYNFRAAGFSLDDEEEQKIRSANFSDTKRLEIQALSNRDSEKGKIIKFALYQADYLDPSLKIQEMKEGFALTLIKHFGFGTDAASHENDGDAIYTRAFKETSPNGFVYLNDTHRPSDQINDSSSSRVISDTGKKDSRISLVQYVLYQKSGARFAEVSREATLHSTPKGLHLRPSLSLMEFIASVNEHVRIAIQTKDFSQYMSNNGANFLFGASDGAEMEIIVGSLDSQVTERQLNDTADLIKQYLEDRKLANEIESVINPDLSIKKIIESFSRLLNFKSSRWDAYVQRMENIFSQPNGSRLSEENHVLGLRIWDEITRSKDLSSLAIAGKLTALDIKDENFNYSLDDIHYGLNSLVEEGYLQQHGLNADGEKQYFISINPHALDQETLEGSRLAKRLDNFSFMKDPLIWVAVLVFTAHLALSAYFRFQTPINASTVTPPQDPILLTSDIVNIPKDFLNLTRSLLEGKVSIKASYHDTDFKGIVAFIVLSGMSLIIYPWIFLMTRSKFIFNKTLFRLGHILQDAYVKILVATLFAVGASNWVEGIYSQIVYGKPIIINWAKMGHGLGLLNHQDVFLFYGVPALLLRVAYLVYRERKNFKSASKTSKVSLEKANLSGSRLASIDRFEQIRIAQYIPLSYYDYKIQADISDPLIDQETLNLRTSKKPKKEVEVKNLRVLLLEDTQRTTDNAPKGVVILYEDKPGSNPVHLAEASVQINRDNSRLTVTEEYDGVDLEWRREALMQRAITLLLLKDAINTWVSDKTRTEAAERMNNRMSQDPRLSVKKIPVRHASYGYYYEIQKDLSQGSRLSKSYSYPAFVPDANFMRYRQVAGVVRDPSVARLFLMNREKYDLRVYEPYPGDYDPIGWADGDTAGRYHSKLPSNWASTYDQVRKNFDKLIKNKKYFGPEELKFLDETAVVLIFSDLQMMARQPENPFQRKSFVRSSRGRPAIFLSAKFFENLDLSDSQMAAYAAFAIKDALLTNAYYLKLQKENRLENEILFLMDSTYMESNQREKELLTPRVRSKLNNIYQLDKAENQKRVRKFTIDFNQFIKESLEIQREFQNSDFALEYKKNAEVEGVVKLAGKSSRERFIDLHKRAITLLRQGFAIRAHSRIRQIFEHLESLYHLLHSRSDLGAIVMERLVIHLLALARGGYYHKLMKDLGRIEADWTSKDTEAVFIDQNEHETFLSYARTYRLRETILKIMSRHIESMQEPSNRLVLAQMQKDAEKIFDKIGLEARSGARLARTEYEIDSDLKLRMEELERAVEKVKNEPFGKFSEYVEMALADVPAKIPGSLKEALDKFNASLEGIKNLQFISSDENETGLLDVEISLEEIIELLKEKYRVQNPKPLWIEPLKSIEKKFRTFTLEKLTVRVLDLVAWDKLDRFFYQTGFSTTIQISLFAAAFLSWITASLGGFLAGLIGFILSGAVVFIAINLYRETAHYARIRSWVFQKFFHYGPETIVLRESQLLTKIMDWRSKFQSSYAYSYYQKAHNARSDRFGFGVPLYSFRSSHQNFYLKAKDLHEFIKSYKNLTARELGLEEEPFKLFKDHIETIEARAIRPYLRSMDEQDNIMTLLLTKETLRRVLDEGVKGNYRVEEFYRVIRDFRLSMRYNLRERRTLEYSRKLYEEFGHAIFEFSDLDLYEDLRYALEGMRESIKGYFNRSSINSLRYQWGLSGDIRGFLASMEDIKNNQSSNKQSDRIAVLNKKIRVLIHHLEYLENNFEGDASIRGARLSNAEEKESKGDVAPLFGALSPTEETVKGWYYPFINIPIPAWKRFRYFIFFKYAEAHHFAVSIGVNEARARKIIADIAMSSSLRIRVRRDVNKIELVGWEPIWFLKFYKASREETDKLQSYRLLQMALALVPPGNPRYEFAERELYEDFVAARETDYEQHGLKAPTIRKIQAPLRGEFIPGYSIRPADKDPNEKLPVMMIFHSFTGRKELSYFDDEERELVARGFEVIRWDLLRHGENRLPVTNSLQGRVLIRSIMEYMNTAPGIDTENIHVNGFSFGAYIAWLLFTHHKYSDQIRSFAMESAPIYDTFLRYKRVFLKNRRFLEHIFETDEDKKLRLMVANLRLNRERIQKLLTDPKYAKKVLVLVSRTDQVVDRRDVRFQERLKGPRVIVSPRDDHYAYYFHDIFKQEKIEHILRNSSTELNQNTEAPNSKEEKIRRLFYGNSHGHLMILKVFIFAFASRFFNYHSNDDRIFEMIKRLYNLANKLRSGLDLSESPYGEAQNKFIQDLENEIQSHPELFLKFTDYSDSVFVRFVHFVWFDGWNSDRFVQEIQQRQSDAFNLAVLLYFADELKLYYLLPGEWEERRKKDPELEAFSHAMDRLLENFKYDEANLANHINRKLLANEDLELVLKRLRQTDEFLNARKLNAPASETHQEIWDTLERIYFGDRSKGSRLAFASKEEEIAWQIVQALKFSVTFGQPLHTVRDKLLQDKILTSYLRTYESMTKLALKKDRESFEDALFDGMIAGLISTKKMSEPYDEEKLSQAIIRELRLAALDDELLSILSQTRPTLARYGKAWGNRDQVKVQTIRQEVEALMRKLDEEILPAIRAENEPFAYLFPTAEDAIAWDAMKILPDKDNWPGYIENLALFKMKKALLTVLGGGFHTRQGSDRNDLYADRVILTEIFPVLDKNLKELSQKDPSSPEYKSLDEETREITALILNALFMNPAYNIPEGRDRDSRGEDFSFPTYKNYFDKLMDDLQEFDDSLNPREVLQAAILRYPELLHTDNPTEVPLYLQFADKRDGAERDQDGQEVAAIFSEFYKEHGGPTKYGTSIQFKHIMLPPKNPLIQEFFLERNHDIPRSQLRFLEKIKASMLSGELFDAKWHGGARSATNASADTRPSSDGARLAEDEAQDEIEIELKKAFHFYKEALSLREEGYYARALDTVSFAIPILNREGKLASGGDLSVFYERIKLLVDEFVSDTTQLFNSRPFFIPKDYGIRFYSWKDFSKWINNPTLVEKILESIKNQKHSTFEIKPGSKNFLLDKNTIALRSKDGAIEFYSIEANGKISLINSNNMVLKQILDDNQILVFEDTHPEFVLFGNILIFRKSKSGQLYIFMLGNSAVRMLDRPMSSEEKKSIEDREMEERKFELEEAKRLADKQFVPYSEDFDTAESILKRIEKFSKAYEEVYLVEAQREAKRLQVRFSEFDNTKDIRKKIKRTKSEYRKTMMSRAFKDARQFRIRIGRKDTPGTIWTKILNQEIRQLKRYKAKARTLQKEFKDHVWSKYRNQKRKAVPLHYRYYWSKRQANVAKKKLIHWIYFESGIMWKSGQLKDLADVQDEIKAARKYDARMLKKTRDRAKKRGVPYAEEDSVEVLRTRIILYSSYHREIKLRAEEQAKEVKIKAAHNVEVGVVANRLKKRLKENEKLEARRARLAKLREEAIQEAEAKGIAVLNTDSVFDILDRIQLSDLTVFPKKTILREEMARLRSNKLQEEIRLGEVFLSTRDPKLFRFLERMQEGEEQAELIQLTPRKVAVSGYVSIAMFQSVDSEETKGKVSYSLGASSAGQIVIPVIRRVGSGSFDLEFDVRSRYTGKRYTKSRYDFIRDGQVVIRGPKAQLDRMSDGQREILSGLNRKNLPTYFRNLSLAKIQEFGMTNILDNRKRRHLSFWGNVHLAVPSNINSGSVRVEITQEKKKGDYVANLWLVKKGMPKLLLDSVYLTQDGEILDHYVLGPFLDIYRDIGNMPSTSKIEDATEDYFDIDFLARGKGNPSAHSIHLKSGEDRIYYFNESTQAVALGMDFEEEGYTTRQAVKLEDDSRGYEYKNYRNGEVHAYAVYKIFYLNEFHKPELVKRYPSKPTERKKEALQSKLDETLLILAESGPGKLSFAELAERMKEPITKRQIQRILGLLVRQQLAKATRGKSATYELTQQGIKRAELLKSSGSRLAAEAPNSKASYIRGRLRLVLDQLERAPFNFELPEKRPITIADISDKIKVARQTLRRHLRLSPAVKKLWDDIYTQAKTIFDQKTETKNSTAAQKLDQRIILQARINQRLNENPNRIARESTVTTIAEALKIDRHVVARRMKASDEVAKAVQSAYLDKTKAKLINTIRRINNQNEKAESKAGIIFISLQPVNLSRESGLDERFVNKSIRQDARVRREIERGVVLTPMQAKLLTAARDLWLKNRAREFYEPLTLQTVSALAGLDKTGFQRYRRIDSKFRKLSDRYLLSGREAIFLNAILETKDLSFVLEPESQKNKDRVVLRKKTHLSESSIRKLASSNRVRREIRWKYRQLQRQFIMTLRQADLDLDSAASFLRSSNKDEVRRLIDLSTKNLDELSNHAVKYQWDTTEIARLYKKLNKLDKLSKGARSATNASEDSRLPKDGTRLSTLREAFKKELTALHRTTDSLIDMPTLDEIFLSEVGDNFARLMLNRGNLASQYTKDSPELAPYIDEAIQYTRKRLMRSLKFEVDHQDPNRFYLKRNFAELTDQKKISLQKAKESLREAQSLLTEIFVTQQSEATQELSAAIQLVGAYAHRLGDYPNKSYYRINDAHTLIANIEKILNYISANGPIRDLKPDVRLKLIGDDSPLQDALEHLKTLVLSNGARLALQEKFDNEEMRKFLSRFNIQKGDQVVSIGTRNRTAESITFALEGAHVQSITLYPGDFGYVEPRKVSELQSRIDEAGGRYEIFQNKDYLDYPIAPNSIKVFLLLQVLNDPEARYEKILEKILTEIQDKGFLVIEIYNSEEPEHFLNFIREIASEKSIQIEVNNISLLTEPAYASKSVVIKVTKASSVEGARLVDFKAFEETVLKNKAKGAFIVLPIILEAFNILSPADKERAIGILNQHGYFFGGNSEQGVTYSLGSGYKPSDIETKKEVWEGLPGYRVEALYDSSQDKSKTTINVYIRDLRTNEVTGESVILSVFHDRKLIFINEFYPSFPEKSDTRYEEGRGRRLLHWILLNYEGYTVLSAASESFQKSFKLMSRDYGYKALIKSSVEDTNEFIDLKLNGINEAKKRNDDAEALFWSSTTIYGKIPTGARLGSSAGVQVAPRSLPLNTTWSGSSIASFFSGVGVAHTAEINGTQLPLQLEKTYIFNISVKDSKLVAEAEGGIRVELDLKKPKGVDAKRELENKLSISDLRQLAQSVNSKIDEDLEDMNIQASKTVILRIDLGFLDNPSYAFYIDELLRVLNQFKNSKEGENVFFQVTGKENLVQYALNSEENKSVLTQNLPGDLKDASVVAVSPATGGTRLSAINIPVESFSEGDLPVFRAIIKLAIFAGRIDLSNIPDKFRNAYSTLTGKVVESQILQQILKGLASLEILKQFALRAITKVPLQQLFQFFRMQKKIEASA